MWNIYSALAQSTMAAHTLYLPWREILSVLPLPPTPPESLSPHWPELNTNYMSHCSAFTATLKPAAPVPHISPLIQTLFQLSWKQKIGLAWAELLLMPLIHYFYFCLFGVFCIVIEVFQIHFTALDFTHKRKILVTIKMIQGFVKVPKIFFHDLILWFYYL